MSTISLLFLAGLAASAPPEHAACDSVAAVAPTPERFESAHFVILHDGGADELRALGARVEAVYQANLRLMRELHVAVKEHEKSTIVFLGQYEEFEAVRNTVEPDGASLGFFDPELNRCVFFDFETHPEVERLRQELAGLQDENWARRKRLEAKIAGNVAEMNERIVQHEAAHMVQAATGLTPPESDIPTWLAEGLAQQFELPFVERGASIGLSVNRYRLREFQQLHANDDHQSELRRLISGEGWQGGADYALAWALTNYLYVRQRERFAAYVQAAVEQRDVVSRLELFESAFGVLDAEFVRRFDVYMSGLIGRHLRAQPEDSTP